MTLSRTQLAVLATLAIALPGQLHAQQTISLRATGLTSRVSVPGPNVAFRLDASLGDGLYCEKEVSFSPEGLKSRLAQNLGGLTAAAIRERLVLIQSKTHRNVKFWEIFRDPTAQPTVTGSTAGDNEADALWQQGSVDNSMPLLAMGQEVTLVSRYKCYTAIQVEQSVDVGVQLMQAIAQQLAPGGPTTSTTPPTGAGSGVIPETGTTLKRQ